MRTRWFSVQAASLPAHDEILAAVAEIAKALPAVHYEMQAWRDEHVAPHNVRPAIFMPLQRVWLLEAALAPARERLEGLGFQLSSSAPRLQLSDEWTDEERQAHAHRFVIPAHRPSVGGSEVDAWQPDLLIALHVQWEPDLDSPAREAAAMLKRGARHLVLARRPPAYGAAEAFLERLFADPSATAAIAAKLPLRGVLLVEI